MRLDVLQNLCIICIVYLVLYSSVLSFCDYILIDRIVSLYHYYLSLINQYNHQSIQSSTIKTIMFDSILMEQQEHCPDTMCAFLPLGFILQTMDIYHDLAWCLFPSGKTGEALRNYYISLLTPTTFWSKWKYIPLYPGYLFPLYAIFVFLYLCPTIYNWYTFFLYIPLMWRYYRIMSNQDKTLKGWWSVIVLRVLLTIVTIYNIQHRNCGNWQGHLEQVAIGAMGRLLSSNNEQQQEL